MRRKRPELFEITKEGTDGYKGNRKEGKPAKRVPEGGSLDKKPPGCDTQNALEKREAERMIWSSEYRSMADALELPGEEGRDKLR